YGMGSDLKPILNPSGPFSPKKKRSRSKKKNSDPAPARTTPAGPQTLKIWDTPIDFQELSSFFRARRCRAGGETKEGGRVVQRIVAVLNRFSGILEQASRIKSPRIKTLFFPSDVSGYYCLPDLILEALPHLVPEEDGSTDDDDDKSNNSTPDLILEDLPLLILEDGSTDDDDDKGDNSTEEEEEGSGFIKYTRSDVPPYFASLPTADAISYSSPCPLPPPNIPCGMPEGPSAPVNVYSPEEMDGWDFWGFPVRDTNLKQFAKIENFNSRMPCDNVFCSFLEKSRPKIREYCRLYSGCCFERITMPPPEELLPVGRILTLLPVSDLIPKKIYEPHLLSVYNCAEAGVELYNERMGQKLVLLAVTNANYLNIRPPAYYIKLMAYDLVTDLIWTCTTEVWYYPRGPFEYVVKSFHREELADAYACPYIPVPPCLMAPMIQVAEYALQFYNKKMRKHVKFSKVSAAFSDAATGRKLVIILTGVDEQESHITYLTEVFLHHGYLNCEVLRFVDLPPNQELDLKFGLYAAKERVSVLNDPHHSEIIKNAAEFALDCYQKEVKDERLELVKVTDAFFHLSWGDTYEITFECKFKVESEDDGKYAKYLFPAVATVIHVQPDDVESIDDLFKLVMFLRGNLKEVV
ncbi:hypothetical protein Tsubulata_031845, partial [Turnera subulata]